MSNDIDTLLTTLVARPPGTASAYTWGDAARKVGVPVNDTPLVGAVAWWAASAGGASASGHVAYVEQVLADGSIVISEDNLSGDFRWRHLTRGTGWPSGFIHYPVSNGNPYGVFDSVTANIAGQIDFWGTSSDPDGGIIAPSYQAGEGYSQHRCQVPWLDPSHAQHRARHTHGELMNSPARKPTGTSELTLYGADRDHPLFELRRAIAAELAAMAEEAKHEANRNRFAARRRQHTIPTGTEIVGSG